MKKRKIKFLNIAVLCLLVFATLLTTFPSLANELGSGFKINTGIYNETKFVSSLATVKLNNLTLAKNGQTEYIIVTSENAKKTITNAVETLQDTFYKMTGARLPVISDNSAPAEKEIIIGSTNRVADFVEKKVGKTDGYTIKTDDDDILISGNNDLGTANGVYSFMEDFLGIMWVSGTETYIPKTKNVNLGQIDKTEVPRTDWRNVYSYEASSENWSAKLKLNGIDGNDPENVNQYSQWGTWCHSYYYYISPDEYFQKHPEYFSMKDGKRINTYEGMEAQLCLSNPEVYNIVKQKMGEEIAENPEKIYWDFSVMDNSYVKGCECDKCKKLDDAAGSGMGSLLPFINKLAKEFPNVYISTLAYFHTITPPTNGLKAEKNVVIKLCAMPGDQASPYSQALNKNAEAFKTRVESWSKITSNIVIWDYVVNFSNLLLPFPNFAVQQENQKFYEDNKVMGIFHQASREKSDEFVNLRTYVLAKLMWQGSDMDVAQVISKYLVAYYGEAAPFIGQYIQLANDKLGTDLGLYDTPKSHAMDYLSTSAIKEYLSLFSQAEKAVEGNEDLTARVMEAKIPVLFAKMNETSLDKQGRLEAGEEFFLLAEMVEISRISEIADEIDEYKDRFPDLVQSSIKNIQLLISAVVLGIILLVLLIIFVAIIIKKAVTSKKAKRNKKHHNKTS